jgi:hypothetical protein
VTVPASVTFAPGPVADGRSGTAAAPASLVADGAATATISVTLRDANGNAVPGETVTLTSSRGAADTISGASGPSDSSGVVTFTVKSTVAGASTYTATDNSGGLGIGQTSTVTFTPGPVSAARSTATASPASVVADGSTTSTITVTILDGNGNAVPGKTVVLASSRGATDTVSAASGPSDASGVVTFPVTSTTAGSPSFTATDATDAIQVNQAARVTFVAGAVSVSQSLLAASAASVIADGEAVTTVTVTLRDAFGNPVAGKNVAIYSGWSSGGSPPLPVTFSSPSGPSDGSGNVTFTVKSTTAGTLFAYAQDTTDAVWPWSSLTVTFTAGPVVDATSTVASSAPSPFADGSTSTVITVTLRDAHGNGVPGKTVVLASSRGAIDTISPASGTTNGGGAVGFNVGSSNNGSAVFSATDQTDSIALGQTASVSFSRYLAFTTQPPSSVTATVAMSPAPAVTLRDAAGSVDPTFQGNVTLSIGANPGVGTLSGTLVVAAVAGVAAFPDVAVDKVGTGYTLAAIDVADGLPSSTSAPFTVVSGPPAKLAFTIQPSNAGAGIAPTFQVSVQDAGGNPTASTGNPVTVTIGTNPSSGTLTGMTTATSRGGVAMFTGLGISAVGAGYTLVATDPTDGFAAATSAPFDIKAPVVVGTGTPASCTEATLASALAAGGNLTFSCGASPVTITLTSQKTITVNTGLDGGSLVTLSGAGATPLLALGPGVTVALQGLGIAGGFTAGNGGAISNDGTLSVTRCTFTGNATSSSNDYRGSPANGGAIFNGGTLIVGSSTFAGNTVHSDSDFYGTSANGGAIYSYGTLLVTDSTFAGNVATASNSFYGTAGNGGAIFNAGGSVTISSSTFSGNGAAASNSFYGTGGRGGALFGGAALTNTLIAGSTGGGNCSGTFTNGGHDLDSDGSCGVGAAANPMLDPAGLGTNGGPTQTVALQAGSPAINAGDQAACAAAPVVGLDQRGYARPGTGATSCSIGAFEYDAH